MSIIVRMIGYSNVVCAVLQRWTSFAGVAADGLDLDLGSVRRLGGSGLLVWMAVSGWFEHEGWLL